MLGKEQRLTKSQSGREPEEMICMAEKSERELVCNEWTYLADEKIYFEMTFTPAMGVVPFYDAFLEEEGKYCVTEKE